MRWLLVTVVACSSSSSTQTKTTGSNSPTERPNVISLDANYEVTTEEVSFTAGTRTIPGTLTAPKADGKWPAVLLLAGSGPTDRDWNSGMIPTKNGSGALLATELSKHGAVVLRFDKAGSGKNSGPPLPEWTIDTYTDEAGAALVLLRARANVRGDRIFVAGHSEGGIHATRLAKTSDFSGIIYLAAASRTMADTVLTQLEAQLKNPMSMLSERAIEMELEGIKQTLADFVAGKTVDPQKSSRIPEIQRLVALFVNPATAKITRPLISFDNAVEAAKLPGPFYISAGGKDVQVDPELDSKRLEKSLRDAKRDVTYHLSPDADHVLKHETKTQAQIRADLKTAQDAYNAEGRVLDEDFVRSLVTWLAQKS